MKSSTTMTGGVRALTAVPALLICLVLTQTALAQRGLKHQPRLQQADFTQEDIARGKVSIRQIRRAGLLVFATPFNRADGYGDGKMDHDDPIRLGGRPTLQNNGTFLRVNGLDGQTCLECHSIISNAVVPARFGIGGVGAATSNAMFMPTRFDLLDEDQNGFAAFDGRFINPPFLFGSGGIELLGKEMTSDLQALRAEAESRPGETVNLQTKGVNFGSIRFVNGSLDTSQVVGVDEDLVVRPFGRKGEFPTTRSFDLDAMRFHFGMEPVEVVGEDIDADEDGIVNEITVGELSSLEIFNTNLDRPKQQILSSAAVQGFTVFQEIGCAECHIPALLTESKMLTYSFPEIHDDPDANVFFSADLTEPRPGFEADPNGNGVIVPLFADLKRHDMGPRLAESFGSDLDAQFTTARLWGVADTAPYLHDGRALTLMDAIMWHGGEALAARTAFRALDSADRQAVISFLKSLRTPTDPAADLQQ